MTRSKRQLNYTPSSNKSSNNNLLINLKKKRILNHQSSPSSSVSTSSSSSLSNRHRDYMRKAKLRQNKTYEDLDGNLNDDNDDSDDSNDDFSTNGTNINKNTSTNNLSIIREKLIDNQNNNLEDENSSSSDSNSQSGELYNYNNNLTVLNNNNNNKSTNSANLEPNEPVYCVCRQISYGQMIMCDNSDCDLEWFHFDCVKLSSKPKGKWYCPQCRGDSHKVMRKNHKK